jgi:hypothetical protein
VLVAGFRNVARINPGRSNPVRAIPTVLEINDLLVDDGRGWPSFTSKYPHPGPAGLLRPVVGRPASQGVTQPGWTISATTHEGPVSIDPDAIRTMRLLGDPPHGNLRRTGVVLCRQGSHQVGGATSAKAIVRRRDRGRLPLGDCDSRPEFAGPSIPSKHDHVVRRYGRLLRVGARLDDRLSRRQAKHPSHLRRHTRCRVSSFGEERPSKLPSSADAPVPWLRYDTH